MTASGSDCEGTTPPAPSSVATTADSVADVLADREPASTARTDTVIIQDPAGVGYSGGLLVNSGTALQLSSALVDYRSPISGGANFLLISGDPATMTRILATIRLHR
jgi:hypothetical protein